MKRIVLTCIAVVAACMPLAATAHADPLGTSIPATCVAHTGWGDGDPDVAGDYRCAGRAIQFHTAEAAASPGWLWAGQWLFVDETGQYRVGSCTFNRGIHPTTGSRSQPVAQTFPNDQAGTKGAYLSWRYGDTSDDLTAAAIWAVFHYYAQDAAGSRRAANASEPLVPALDRLAAMSGDAELQARAIALDADAQRFSGPWTLTLDRAADGAATAVLRAGDVPVEGATIRFASHEQEVPVPITTDRAGHASASFSVDVVRVTVTTDVPGASIVYRGQPASPDSWGAQTLVTGGVPGALTATAVADVPELTTTTTSTTMPGSTTTAAPATTAPGATTTTDAAATTGEPATTSSQPATTSSQPATSTIAPTTTTIADVTTTTEGGTTTGDATTTTTQPAVVEQAPPTLASSTTTAPAASTAPPHASPAPPELPRTGGAGTPAYFGTALLVAGVGLLGTIRRRTRRPQAPFFDPD